MDKKRKLISSGAVGGPDGVYQALAGITFNDELLKAGLAICSSVSDPEPGDKEFNLLHPEEIMTGHVFPSRVRQRNFLQGRIAAKLAMNLVFPEIPAASVHIITGSFGEPLFKNLAHPYGISITHGESWSAGLCFPLSVPMGIDMESISEKNGSIIQSILNDQERKMCGLEANDQEMLHLLWTAKEAAGKAIRLGFRVPHTWYEVASFETIRQGRCKILLSRFTHLTMFTVLSVIMPDAVLSIAFPAEMKCDLVSPWIEALVNAREWMENR